MIDAASSALEEGTIDSYSVEQAGHGYRVKVAVGKKFGEAYGETEEKAYAAALKDVDKDDDDKSTAKKS